jgi:hypothetical protein
MNLSNNTLLDRREFFFGFRKSLFLKFLLLIKWLCEYSLINVNRLPNCKCSTSLRELLLINSFKMLVAFKIRFLFELFNRMWNFWVALSKVIMRVFNVTEIRCERGLWYSLKSMKTIFQLSSCIMLRIHCITSC